MIILPSLLDYVLPRPHRPSFEEAYVVPHKDEKAFWNNMYKILRDVKIYSPVRCDIKKCINPLSGYFGYRVHPVTKESRYFHVGLSLDVPSGHKIYPVLPGVLEYSGYGAVNGYYVLLSHPHIQTEDGYVLHTMYCHLKKPLVRFNSYQKMLREISLGSHPQISIDTQTVLGVASTTGLSRDHHPGLYFQVSFRKFDQTPIVIDPWRLYYARAKENTTAEITNIKKIDELFND